MDNRHIGGPFPTGTVTFLFTDIEGSTRLLARLRTGYAEVLSAQKRLLREAFAAHDGVEVDNQGDSFLAAFGRASDAVEAAATAQRTLIAHEWPDGADVRVRMGIHAAEAVLDGDRYVGLGLHRAARVGAAGHGGQVLLSAAARELVADELPAAVELRDLGERQLKDFDRPERLYQALISGLPDILPGPAAPPVRDVAARTLPELVGREEELEAIRTFGAASSGALVLEGDAGIGKTSLFEAACTAARAEGRRVLTCRPSPGELKLAFAGLSDMLDPSLPELLPQLPGVQRRALEVAVLFADGPAPETRVLGAAVLTCLRALGGRAGVLVAVDDLQWLDEGSLAVLEYALRRLDREPVSVLLAVRGTPGASLPLSLERTSVEPMRLPVTPLTMGAAGRLLHERLGLSPPRVTLRRLHERSGGNPFYVLELGRALAERGDDRLPESLRALVRDRIVLLPETTQRALLLAASLAEPTQALVADDDALEPAFAAGVLDLDGTRLRFTHPLLAEAVYEEATPLRRRKAHRLLAERVSGEERVRQLALGAEGPDEQIAAALVQGSAAASRRGALAAAADLAERALALTPPDDTDAIHRRRIQTADAQGAIGQTARQRELLESARDDAPAGLPRAEALWRLALVLTTTGENSAAPALFEEALGCATGDPALSAEIYLATSTLDGWAGPVERAQAALAYAEQAGEPRLLTRALGELATALFTHGHGFRRDLFERAVELQQTVGYFSGDPRARGHYGWASKWAGDLEGSRALLEEELAAAYARDDAVAFGMLWYLGWLEVISGNWDHALDRFDAMRRVMLDNGLTGLAGHAIGGRAVVEAHLGRLEEARVHIEETRGFDAPFSQLTPYAAAVVALADGDPAEVVRELEPVAAGSMRHHDPGLQFWFPAYVEGLIEVGRLDDADAFITALDEHARRLDRRWALAMCAEFRGLIAAARGEVEAGLAELEQAVLLHEGVGRPFDRACTLLALGKTLRRAKRKRDAREVLEAALAVFEELGAHPWVERTRAELGRIGGRRPSGDELTPTERRVAELVAGGRSNKQTAAELYVSVHTVEDNLKRVYRKLGVHTRTELAHRLPEP